MTVNEFRNDSNGSDRNASRPSRHTDTLISRLTGGTPYAVTFGGQGTPWLPALAELVIDAELDHSLAQTVDAAERLLAPVLPAIDSVRPDGFDPLTWVHHLAADRAVPTPEVLAGAAQSVPGILLTQIAALAALAKQGLDTAEIAPRAVAGHSQGVLATDVVADAGGRGALLALAHLIGAAGATVARRTGLAATADGSPMVSVSKVDPDRLIAVLDEHRASLVGEDAVIAPVVAIRNGRRSVAVAGSPRQLRALEQRCDAIAAAEAAERKAKTTGGAPFAPTFDPVAVTIAFHHPGLADAVDLVADWAARCGLDVEWARAHATAILVAPCDWVRTLDDVADSGVKWLLDLGPSDSATRLSVPNVRGRGIGCIPASSRGGQRNVFAPGGVPSVPAPWSVHAPSLATLPGGRTVVETAFTRLTGRSPMLLAGMTPTTVDPAIVAAAANAGHWAELAGGGQVTEAILADNLGRLHTLLEPGRQAQFNALFLDPYLWKLQLGGKRLVQKARAAGSPIDGVVVSAGIPELDEAVALVEELVAGGIPWVAFKPGTVEQIRSVVRIAAEVPAHPVIVHIEGGRAGGHHSWEDLDDLLLATYAELRARPNAVICVGGGIGSPERAADYLTGRWSTAHGFPAMPVDGILLGTVTMAVLEATTSPAVKQLLVDTPGCDTWIGAGHSGDGMASGRSQLGADIHEVDNAASACGRLLDEVAGDADAVAQRRDEIVAALDATAKPYFGDVASMTYRQWLTRYADLAVGVDPGPSPAWADVTWRDRFVEMLQRTEARMHPADRGHIATSFVGDAATDNPHAAVDVLGGLYPEIDADVLHPADVAFFLGLCRTPGKPVNFVPVVDADVRRWWRSDSLWQAHDARYGADEVCIIPGPVAVAGITRVDEPVGDLLDRFEAHLATELGAAGVEPVSVPSRRAGIAGRTGVLATALAADSVEWAGRMVPNPITRLGDIDRWEFLDGDDRAEHGPTGATLTRIDGGIELVVPVAASSVTIPMRLDSSFVDGGAPRVDLDDASAAMRTILAVAAGELPEVVDGVATITARWGADLAADHAGVTTHALPQRLSASTPSGSGGFAVPDAIVGLAWPSVFAVIGAARSQDGRPVVEGLLDLVHLDHAVATQGELPRVDTDVTVTASLRSVSDATVGRVVCVDVDIAGATGTLATLTERFAIRGRTGADELSDPVRAGGAVLDERPATRALVRTARVTAPARMHGFAAVSGDRNPIHTDLCAARLAGLGEPIVHGMWLSALAQHVATATDADRPVPAPRPLLGWTARYLGMVRTGDEVTVRVDRVGLDQGAEVVEVTCSVDGDLVLAATGRLAAPRTVYAFPGQGIQSAGMGLAARARSAAARDIWDRADAHTRAALGFSILAVVRDNPTRLVARGTTYTHPDGVLFLTQFTQVAMATLGVAQVAELRESGGFIEGAITCGHSVGEYNALAACAGVLPLEAVLEVVFQRGEAMHHLVPRDELGRSDYRLAAIRPSQFGVADDEVVGFVADVARACGEFLEVVNLNQRGTQYAIAGTVRGLENLEAHIERRRAEVGGKRGFILIPGIDVPFHSSVLRDGVPEFRARLQELLPTTLDPDVLVGRYIPNLVPRPFCLDRDFVTEIADLVPSQPLADVLDDWDTASADRNSLARTVLIELLAWQFASPVRWIETQDLLFAGRETGGLGVQRFVEVGVVTAPTLSGLATNTLKLDAFAGSSVQVFNVERDSQVLLSQDEAPEEFDETPAEDAAETAPAPAAAPAAPATPAPAAAAGPRPDDIAFGPADAVRAVIALWTKMRPDQIGTADTIEALCDGVSSRRNQLLLDVGAELGLGAIDGAAEADMTSLSSTVDTMARGYKPFGSVLTDAVGDALRKVLGPINKRPAYVEDRVTSVWQLGPGWARHATVALALGTRDGASVRGGDLGGLVDGGVGSADALDAAIDAAVAAVGAQRGVAVSKPAADTAAGGTVDVAALGALTEQFTGRSGALASAARTVLRKLGLDEDVDGGVSADAEDARTAQILSDRVSAELGSDWLRTVTPTFDARTTVLLDDRWASAREDLARLWIADDHELDAEFETVTRPFAGAGHTVAQQATWWQGKALHVGDGVRARVYAQIAHLAEDPAPAVYRDEVAVVTGASAGSIAAAVVGRLLAGGATVVATTSRLDESRLSFFKQLYREHARDGAALWVASANMYSYTDVDDLVEWIGSEQSETAGGATTVVKPALRPTLLFPFAAPRVAGDLSDAGPRAELEMKVLLWSVERLVAGLGELGADHDIDGRVHAVLPGSPNRGMFGGDGAYGESKAALDALVARWSAESSWNSGVTLAHAIIGWVRGTGLMGHNDPMVSAVEAAGVRTWSTSEMADELLALCTPERRESARTAPIVADLTAGLGEADLDLAALAAQAQASAAEETVSDAPAETAAATVPALPAPARPASATTPTWPALAVDPADLVVIVGAGELGPYGSARTRFEMEVSDELSAAGVLELAWSTGLITWEQTPKPGWYDAESGDPVAEHEVADRYHDTVVERCGIRRYGDDGEMVDNAAPLLTSVFLDEDLTFTVASEDEAKAFAASDPDRTTVRAQESGEWEVTRRAGTEIRVPRRFTLSRTVGGQIPSGFDPTVYGISADMAASLDRVALWNLVATVDAFLGSGFDPAELMRWVHPGLVANTQGTGMGGMESMRSLYIDTLLGESKANDILQEALPNVIAAHVVQSYVGSYGAMIHPVAACATAAVSVEEGVDKIRLGKALFAVAGGFDDLGIEGIVGFGDMSATADSAVMAARGIEPRRFSRANDRRRGGFVESQGGGTVLLARGDVAADMGLPVLGVVAWAQSFGDGVHTSIPAPGIGALGAARGRTDSPMARALRELGVSPDDVAVVSKHDTSTKANDPNEADLHERVAGALGRNDGAPLFVVSQKSLTGHAKGGAAAFQLIGLCQMLRDGVIPPNRSLDCVDDAMREHPHLVWVTQALDLGERFPLKAGLLTSLGFGHVSGLVAVVHPEAFVASLDADRREAYRAAAAQRSREGARRRLQAMCGGEPLYQRPPNRRLGDAGADPDREAAMLLDESVRLGAGGDYPAAAALTGTMRR